MRARGFTLVEVLIASVLLAAGLTLAFATLGGATGATRRGEETAQANERVRAVEGFLRRRLAGARAVPFQMDPATNVPIRFSGGPDRMRFVSDLPDYIGRGGPHVHELRVERNAAGEGVRLMLALAVHRPLDAPPVPEPEPEVLAEDMREVAFRYRGPGREGKPGEWQNEWTAVEQLPLLVEIRLTGLDGRPWPVLTVAPRLASGYSTGATL